ncbi:MAG: phosphoadenylyl-sulfate reductase [Pseudohongiella sp.]|nr:phosphoadenylyl-sulfate reductase [Pseudohongiella sp.]MDP2127665.1 phosphoadenylyl-sulfate reductase [Pseudohongiella sp.]
MINASNIAEINEQFQNLEPRHILQEVLNEYPHAAISFSGAEDVALVVMAKKIRPDIRVFTLDTGRLHPETYRFIELVREQYALDIEFLYPDTEAVQALTREKGLFSFYRDGHEQCCGIRKTEPLRRKLASVDAWITGQRKDQSPTRTNVPIAQIDTTFAGPGKTLLKFNPFANWRSKDVWDYIRMFELPYNPLHDRGFISIGCEPCTKAVGPNQHEREGRWWWEEATAKECGLHALNIE